MVPLLLGALIAVLLGLVFVRHITGPLTRFSTERPLEGDLPAGAERTIYVVGEQSGARYGLGCTVTETGSGRLVPTDPGSALTLTLNEESFVALESFEVDRAGRYRVSCSGSQPARLAIGPRLRIFREVGRVFGAVIALLGGFGATAVVVTVVALRRHQHRRRLQGLV